MNNRLLPRLRRRLKVKIGGLQTFTSDITTGGFAAELMYVVQPGAELHGEIELCGQHFPYTGTVSWAKKGEPRMNLRGRIGVKFTEISASFFELFKTAYTSLTPAPSPS